MKESLDVRHDVVLKGYYDLLKVKKYLEEHQTVPYEIEDCLEWLSNEVFKVDRELMKGITEIKNGIQIL